MYILAIDTSHATASCALCQDEKLVDWVEKQTNLSHSEAILPLCMELLEKNAVKLDDIGLFAVCHGPGSFTGLRIGVSIIKAFAHTLEVPAVGVSALMAVGLASGKSGLVCPMVTARGQEQFYGLYTIENGQISPVGQEDAMELDQALDFAAAHNAQPVQGVSNAQFVGKCAYQLYKNGQTVDAHRLEPIYLKLSQAERMRMNKENG